MQPTIHLLSDETINQIAAGEVIESPASVVKELVENALDAGAQKITVEITGGGLKLIRIIDDGCGMHRTDLRLSVVRHATSKITQPQDLFHIETKGFRGEALASIASISKMVVMTAQEGAHGDLIEVEKGSIVKERACARNKGTTIEIRSLFYNVPARRKFQKTAAAISAEIFRTVTVMGLSHPNVQFELISNGRKAIKTVSKDGIESRAKELLGEEFVSGSFPLEFESGEFRFSGLIGAPTNNRNNKLGQFLFLNQRAVACDEVSEAVREGYATRLDEKRHPIFLLHLQLPGDLIDVNVHPQKLQVRLRNPELVCQKVSRAVGEALAKSIKKVELPKVEFTAFEPVAVDYSAPLLKENIVEEEQELRFDQDLVEVMGQVGRFLLLQEGKEMILVDLHAANFRIIFEDLIEKSESKAEKQGLLIPLEIELSSIESAMVLTHLDAIEALGFTILSRAKGHFSVEAIPPFVSESEVKQMLCDMAHHLQEFIGKQDYEKERQRALARSAARFSKPKNQYSKEEAKRFFDRLRACASPLHCPKGNKTMVHVTDDTIENLFRTNQKTTEGASL